MTRIQRISLTAGNIDTINKQLSRGVLPDCLNFTLEPKPMDISQIKYNAFYRSYEYV